ncbi:hypothetical protein H1230_06915 [Paenibacillus sp. 19GGS1-52]|uniref:hypothetical protein n=1 Tax=Paenibacillus sp. 19GGS1-52 TaxID=2758563 RepID=UPI001EFA3842|nr:hypothetical protein [Paenibacillus sp. 19GGS1-52]ULO08532.1 hypothetical protein H1230_06915 [Paenibacillus sp. 19GGS1-52]
MLFKKWNQTKEYALPIEWEPSWDVGAPIPQVISSGYQTYLIYYIGEASDDWDGINVKVIDPDSNEVLPIAVVKFNGCYAYKFGGANDEVMYGHPLYKKGLKFYSAHKVINSKWIKAEEKINSIHDYYKPERWKDRIHYLLLFHDELFECIADGYEITMYKESIESVLFKVLSEMN